VEKGREGRMRRRRRTKVPYFAQGAVRDWKVWHTAHQIFPQRPSMTEQHTRFRPPRIGSISAAQSTWITCSVRIERMRCPFPTYRIRPVWAVYIVEIWMGHIMARNEQGPRHHLIYSGKTKTRRTLPDQPLPWSLKGFMWSIRQYCPYHR
jgi:hypothetical protein